ncbi:MAG TPA: hypothetical protein VNO26_05480 [Candidatus Limnocylindria bacterium]|nr:hypothetical protein [Candidatus Limnocylindria bacterium]
MGMRILAIGGGRDTAEHAEALAGAAGISLYEAKRHLAAGSPRVLATYGDPAAAAAAAAALGAAGFAPIVLDDEVARRERFLVRSFVLGARTLGVKDRTGTRREVPFASIAVMVRGIRALGPDDREPFLDLHVPGDPVLAFCEGQLQYDGLHLERQPTAAVNFARLTARLREQAPHAHYDDRLNTRAGQLALLGERLAPESYLEAASLVLARALHGLAAAA